jgi:tRNA threonylcarbamoyladenosine biosynthesis protein TsaE
VTDTATIAIELPDEAATRALAADLARHTRPGDVIGLSGALGSGKTTFARAFIGARIGVGEVPSPTFTLVEVYQSLTGPAVWHFDLYRLEKPEDAYELGIEDAFAEGISLIEWPERLGALLPRDHLGVTLVPGASETERLVQLRAPHSWVARIPGLSRG